MVIFLCLLATLLLSCGQPPAAVPEPTSSQAAPLPVAPVQEETSWPTGELQLDEHDWLDFTESQGGVAGTDFETLRVQGDGVVTLETGRAGGPGGRPSVKQGRLDAETTRKIFQGLHDSGVLDSTVAHTDQHYLSVSGQVDDVKFDVGVAPGSPRQARLEELLAPARACLQ